MFEPRWPSLFESALQRLLALLSSLAVDSRHLGLRGEIGAVDIMDDHVVVKARCEGAGADSSGESVSRTVWIREKGKFFLATKNDTSPEPIFAQPSK